MIGDAPLLNQYAMSLESVPKSLSLKLCESYGYIYAPMNTKSGIKSSLKETEHLLKRVSCKCSCKTSLIYTTNPPCDEVSGADGSPKHLKPGIVGSTFHAACVSLRNTMSVFFMKPLSIEGHLPLTFHQRTVIFFVLQFSGPFKKADWQDRICRSARCYGKEYPSKSLLHHQGVAEPLHVSCNEV